MDPTVRINERVEVVAVYRLGDLAQACLPARMRYRGHEVAFTKLGMHHPTSKGKRMIHVFEMSDGTNDYRLEFDAERLTWQLVSMVEGGYVR